MIIRHSYLEKLISSKDTDYVKLLVGVRRSGKSTILKMMINYLIESGISISQIIGINYEMLKFDKLKDGLELHRYIEKVRKNREKIYLFIYEVQEIDEWARVVNSLRVSFDIDIYVTGSNANMFSGEHLTYLAGRYLTIRVYPLSYYELLTFVGDENNYEAYYDTFLESSFPAVVLTKNKLIRNQLKEDIFNTIFGRDIILRGRITREREFYAVARYILEHIGTQISANKIFNKMKSNHVDTSYDRVNEYLDLMLKSYFLYECNRYDVKGRKELKTFSKYYAVDFGIRSQIIPNEGSNRGKVLENFVYLELIKHGYRVYTGKVGRDYEIDFVAIKEKETKYIQVTESLIDPQTRQREARPFDYINDNNKRVIISLDKIDYSTDKYLHLNLFDFIKKLN